MNAASPTIDLTPIHLVGSLGRAVGRNRFDMDVKSVPEALRAINIVTKGKLERYLSGPGRDKGYRIALQRRDNTIDPDEAMHRSGRLPIYIVPAIRGRNSGVGKILTGAALIAMAFINPLGLAAGGKALAIFTSVTVGFGTSLILGGITQMLTPKAQTPEEQRQSTEFVGNASAVVQGGCVPLVYGRALVSPIPISVTVDNNDVSTTDAGTEGTVEVDDLQGGGQQYTSADIG